jgi:hypothetical protein
VTITQTILLALMLWWTPGMVLFAYTLINVRILPVGMWRQQRQSVSSIDHL